MSVNEKVDLVIRQYTRQPVPTVGNTNRFLEEELRRLETIIDTLSEAAIQATDTPPTNPRKGTVRFALSPWDSLGTGNYNILVVYNGTAWVAV
mgnify:CR=1 FL=1|jgi:hypothetical protein